MPAASRAGIAWNAGSHLAGHERGAIHGRNGACSELPYGFQPGTILEKETLWRIQLSRIIFLTRPEPASGSVKFGPGAEVSGAQVVIADQLELAFVRLVRSHAAIVARLAHGLVSGRGRTACLRSGWRACGEATSSSPDFARGSCLALSWLMASLRCRLPEPTPSTCPVRLCRKQSEWEIWPSVC